MQPWIPCGLRKAKALEQLGTTRTQARSDMLSQILPSSRHAVPLSRQFLLLSLESLLLALCPRKIAASTQPVRTAELLLQFVG